MVITQDGDKRYKYIYQVYMADFKCGECGAEFTCQHGEFLYNKNL